MVVAEALTCFKAYDIRGRLGNELNEDIAYRIGRAYAQYLNAKRAVVVGDVRLTSEPLKQALAKLMDGGADVIDIGMTGTVDLIQKSIDIFSTISNDRSSTNNPVMDPAARPSQEIPFSKNEIESPERCAAS
jgi:phosphomannomutase